MRLRSVYCAAGTATLARSCPCDYAERIKNRCKHVSFGDLVRRGYAAMLALQGLARMAVWLTGGRVESLG